MLKINYKSRLGLLIILSLPIELVQANCLNNTGGSCSATSLPVEINDSCIPNNINQNGMAFGQTFFTQRPQYSNTARNQLGDASRIHKWDQAGFGGNLSYALEYSQSTNDTNLGRWFFFNGDTIMNYGLNTTAENYNQFTINSTNFGITGSGKISTLPHIQNLVADFRLFLSWDNYLKGLWSNINMPINYVRTDMRLQDSNPDSDTNLITAWSGQTNNDQIGIINGRRAETKIAGLVLEIGYDFIQNQAGHLGLAIRAVAPTGNTPNANYVFEPVAGNNKCWEFGLDFTGAYHITDNISFYVDGNLTHIFSGAQKRLLGLQNIRSGSTNNAPIASPGATWLMLQQYDNAGGALSTTNQASNLLALVLKIDNAIMFDMSSSFEFSKDNYTISLGYNLWARSQEQAKNRQASVFATENWGIVPASGISSVGATTIATKAASNISAAGTTTSATSGTQYLTDDDITACPALNPAVFTNKIFTAFNYTYREHIHQPYVLIGLSYEIAGTIHHIKNSALSQWSVINKMGFSF